MAPVRSPADWLTRPPEGLGTVAGSAPAPRQPRSPPAPAFPPASTRGFSRLPFGSTLSSHKPPRLEFGGSLLPGILTQFDRAGPMPLVQTEGELRFVDFAHTVGSSSDGLSSHGYSRIGPRFCFRPSGKRGSAPIASMRANNPSSVSARSTEAGSGGSVSALLSLLALRKLNA